MTLLSTVLAWTLAAASPASDPQTMNDPLHHPGTIVYVNEVTGEVTSEPISKVPKELRFADGIPIARVVYSADGQYTHIQEFAADGHLLRSTLGLR